MKKISDPRLLRQRLVLGDEAQRRLLDTRMAPIGHPVGDDYLRRAGVVLTLEPNTAEQSEVERSTADDDAQLRDAQSKASHQLKACLRAVALIARAIEE